MLIEKKDWLATTNDPELQEKVREKIAVLQLFEKEIPAVFVVHDLTDFSVVYMSERGLNELQVNLEDIRLPNDEYHAKFFNEEDARIYVPKILGLIERNNSDELVSYFQQVRTAHNEDWVWHLSSTKIFLRNKDGKPLLTITMAVKVETEHPMASKVGRLLEEYNFLQRHIEIFETLTRREKEILKMMALGINSCEIAEKLHISEATANTHRRNIRNKIQAQNIYDITRFAQAFDLI
ncbi:MAG TPA: helix-turn-helix transcriptional regulator [Flavisolibacter sp.]|nr:helix-turn-helix transcriptional regulator [Flavisolibacter sp.]